MKRESVINTLVFCALVTLAVMVRLVSPTPNFNAVTAAALFAGFYFRHRATAVCVPLLVMTVSDVFLGGYDRLMMVAVYGSMLIPIAWRSVLRKSTTPVRVGLGAISSSLAFFVLTNVAVWYAWHPHTGEALVRCYVMALPFFANALVGDLLFAAGFFGLHAIAVQLHAAPAMRRATNAA